MIIRFLLFLISLISLCSGSGCIYRSPGTLYPSSSEALSAYQSQLLEEMQHHVEELSETIGPRPGTSLKKILEAERWLEKQLQAMGIESKRDEVDLGTISVANIEVSFSGLKSPDEIIVIGAHYDTVPGSPGANDNASGVALLLATAKRLKNVTLDRTVRLVFFVNEENPFSGGIQMGSRVYADRCRSRNDNIVAMLCVDSIGYYSSDSGSQKVPPFIGGIPSRGNFVAFGSNRENRHLVDCLLTIFQEQCRFPSIGVASDMKDMSRSDHAPFWWADYPALFLTDTSQARDPHYHQPTDIAENLNYIEMARFAEGFIKMVIEIARAETRLH